MRNIRLGILFFFCLVTSFVYAESTVRIAPLTISIKSTTTTVGGTAVPIPTTALKGRESIAIYNVTNATETVWIGASDVTSANGFPLNSSTPSISLDVDDSVVVYAISDGTNVDVRCLEAK